MTDPLAEFRKREWNGAENEWDNWLDEEAIAAHIAELEEFQTELITRVAELEEERDELKTTCEEWRSCEIGTRQGWRDSTIGP